MMLSQKINMGIQACDVYPEDKYWLKGHNAPGILCFHGSNEFEVLHKTLNHVKDNFDKDAISREDKGCVYESCREVNA